MNKILDVRSRRALRSGVAVNTHMNAPRGVVKSKRLFTVKDNTPNGEITIVIGEPFLRLLETAAAALAALSPQVERLGRAVNAKKLARDVAALRGVLRAEAGAEVAALLADAPAASKKWSGLR